MHHFPLPFRKAKLNQFSYYYALDYSRVMMELLFNYNNAKESLGFILQLL